MRTKPRAHLATPVSSGLVVPIGHAGHWIEGAIFSAPALALVAVVLVDSLRNRRRRDSPDDPAGPREGEPPSDATGGHLPPTDPPQPTATPDQQRGRRAG